MTKTPRKLWEHADPTGTAMYGFLEGVNHKYGLRLQTYDELFHWSVTRRSDFWGTLFDAGHFIYDGAYTQVVDETLPIDAVPRWFEGVRLNFAENMLYARPAGAPPSTASTVGKEDDRVAVTAVREGGASEHTRHVTWGELRQRAGQLAAAMAVHGGVQRGDRIVVVGANSLETLLVWIASCWLGALVSTSSTDMGAAGLLQRATPLNPRLLFMDDAAVYAGRTLDLRGKMGAVVAGLRAACPAFRHAVAMPRFAQAWDVGTMESEKLGPIGLVMPWTRFFETASRAPVPPFARIAFSDPMLVCFSSGTTGAPKAIVHAAGALLLNLYKEGALHESLGGASVTLQYTTTGWVMYVAAVAVLVLGARTVLYDGSPLTPDAGVLVRLAARERVTQLGVSPRWMHEVRRQGFRPRDLADLATLETVTSTGMVLSPELQTWFYDEAFAAHVHLANISGGTDIAGCFGIANPLVPLHVGGAQSTSLGIDVRLFDTSAESEGESAFVRGIEVPHGEPGELVAVAAFPNIPCFFWADPGSQRVSMTPGEGRMRLDPAQPAAPPGSRYHDAYFARFHHAWAHGDFCARHPVTGSLDFLGRADGVLNPSGVRFGSAEIYGVIDRLFAGRIADALCVGQRRPGRDDDERVFLFVLMHPGHHLDARLAHEIRSAIAAALSKRHVPRYIFATPAIPTTVNMKKVELPVKRIINGESITPSGTLLNPESLDFYRQFADIESIPSKL